MSPWRPSLDREKYTRTILFLLNSLAANSLLGKVKLFKLLYYADFDHFQVYGTPITGDTYRKLPFGPVPRNAETILAGMEKKGIIEIRRKPIGDFFQYEFVPATLWDAETRDIELGHFQQTELKVLEQVVEKWCHHNTTEIVAATHGEAPWRGVEMGEEIPYGLAHYRSRVFDEESNDEEVEE